MNIFVLSLSNLMIYDITALYSTALVFYVVFTNSHIFIYFQGKNQSVYLSSPYFFLLIWVIHD